MDALPRRLAPASEPDPVGLPGEEQRPALVPPPPEDSADNACHPSAEGNEANTAILRCRHCVR